MELHRFSNGSRQKLPMDRAGLTVIELLVAVSIVLVLVSLGLPALMAAREAAKRTQCLNNCRQLAQGVLSIESTRGRLPDNRSLAWTKQLPSSLLGLIESSQREGAPATQVEMSRRELAVFRCPSDVQTEVNGFATSNYTFNPTIFGWRLNQVHDGTSNTLMLSESPSSMAAPWAIGPETLTASIRSVHPRQFHVTLADGAARGLSQDIDEVLLASLLTPNGGETISLP